MVYLARFKTATMDPQAGMEGEEVTAEKVLLLPQKNRVARQSAGRRCRDKLLTARDKVITDRDEWKEARRAVGGKGRTFREKKKMLMGRGQENSGRIRRGGTGGERRAEQRKGKKS